MYDHWCPSYKTIDRSLWNFIFRDTVGVGAEGVVEDGFGEFTARDDDLFDTVGLEVADRLL